MANITRSGVPSVASALPCAAHKITGLLAGEAIAGGDACYIKSDGLVWRSIGTTTNAAAKVDGFAATTAPSGEAVTLYHGVVFGGFASLTPGARFYVSATSAGYLNDSATTGGTGAVATAITSGRILVSRSTY